MSQATIQTRIQDLTFGDRVWSVEHHRIETFGEGNFIEKFILRLIQVDKDGNDCFIDNNTKERYHIHGPKVLGLYNVQTATGSKTLVTVPELKAWLKKILPTGKKVYTDTPSTDFGKNVDIKIDESTCTFGRNDPHGQLFYRQGSELTYDKRCQYYKVRDELIEQYHDWKRLYDRMNEE